MEFNSATLLGNLCNDPETRHVNSGNVVCNFRLAVNRRRGGDHPDEVLYMDIEVWGRPAEVASQYLRRGSQCLVHGRLKLDQWQDSQTGQNRQKILLVASQMQLVSQPHQATQPNTGDSSQKYQQTNARPYGQQQNASQAPQNAQNGPLGGEHQQTNQPNYQNQPQNGENFPF